VSKILCEKKKKIPSDSGSGSTLPRKKRKPDIETTVVNWARKAQKLGQLVTDDDIKQKAQHLATQVGDEQSLFEISSHSWLEDFRQKNGIVAMASGIDIPDASQESGASPCLTPPQPRSVNPPLSPLSLFPNRREEPNDVSREKIDVASGDVYLGSPIALSPTPSPEDMSEQHRIIRSTPERVASTTPSAALDSPDKIENTGTSSCTLDMRHGNNTNTAECSTASALESAGKSTSSASSSHLYDDARRAVATLDSFVDDILPGQYVDMEDAILRLAERLRSHKDQAVKVAQGMDGVTRVPEGNFVIKEAALVSMRETGPKSGDPQQLALLEVCSSLVKAVSVVMRVATGNSLNDA